MRDKTDGNNIEINTELLFFYTAHLHKDVNNSNLTVPTFCIYCRASWSLTVNIFVFDKKSSRLETNKREIWTGQTVPSFFVLKASSTFPGIDFDY